MNPIPVLPSETPAASTSASQADRSSSGPEADSGFGPALLAASNASPSSAAGAATEGKPSAGPGAATQGKPSAGSGAATQGKPSAGSGAATQGKPFAGPGGPQRPDSKQPSRGGSGQGQTAGVDGSVAAAAMVASALAAPCIATGSPAVAAAAAEAGDAIDAHAATGDKAGTDPASTAAPEPGTDALRLILAERERSQALAAGSQDPAGTDATAGVLRADGSMKGDAARTAAQAMRDAAAAAADAADAAGQNPVADFNAPGLPAGAASLGRDGVQAIAQALNGALQAAAPKALVDASSQTGAPAAVSTADSARPDGASATVAFTAAAPYASDVRDSVATPVGHPQFAQDLSQHVVVMARNGVQSAQISLEPAGLGPVGVSIQVNGHSATLAFTAAHEATRNALQDALPRLREMFASSGMQLSDATVGGRSQPDWGTPAQPQAWGRADESPAAGSVASPETGATTRPEAARLVDTYA